MWWALVAGCGDNLDGPRAPCGDGFVEDGDSCVDVDECALAVDRCDARASCTNQEGSFSCACPAGWLGDGTTCVLAPCRFDYRAGHGDLYATWSGPAGLSLALRAALGGAEQTYDPAEVCIHVPRSTYDDVVGLGGRPPGVAWDAVGVGEGEAFWYLPEQPVDGVPWLGIASDPGALGGVPVGALADRLRFAVAVSPPPGGVFSAWSTVDDPEAPPFLFSTRSGQREAQLVTSSHAHLSWAFSRAGEYLVEVVVHGTVVASGQAQSSPPATFRFVVAP
jgi:surface-anchored protein